MKSFYLWEASYRAGTRNEVPFYVLSHSWYRARAGAEVVCRIIADERSAADEPVSVSRSRQPPPPPPRVPAVDVTRVTELSPSTWSQPGSYIAVSSENGVTRVFRARQRCEPDLAGCVVQGEVTLGPESVLEDV